MKQPIIAKFFILAFIMLLSGCNASHSSLASVEDTAQTAQEEYVAIESDLPEKSNSPEEILPNPENTHAEVDEESQANTSFIENPGQTTSSIASEKSRLDEAQKNSIAMLNYLAVLTQEINSSQNSRMFLEEAYASLINNTNPEKINELTESHLSSMLDIIEKYRMISVKRDRLQYIYDQNNAKALKEAMPNPVGVLSAINSFDLKRLAASAIYMAIDSYSSYQAYNNDISQDFLQNGWILDDEEAETLHASRKRAFLFMVDIVREYNLPGEYALNENAVDKFVTWKNSSNNYQKIQFFESEESTYKAFANYWLELANCYYETGNYEKCLAAMDKYEELQTNIFRKDYYLAHFLPKAIVAANEIYDQDKYIAVAERYIKLILENTENSEWSLQYFAAEMYIDLYAKTNNAEYLDKAYELALNNVNNLVAEQLTMNSIYLSDVFEIAIPNDATKEEQKQIKAYNKFLKTQRKTELPPIYEPLLLNCELLFALAEERNLTQAEKNKIEGILRGDGNILFLSKVLEDRFSFTHEVMDFEAQFKKNTLILPASCLTERSVLKVAITNDGNRKVYGDWAVKEVKRSSDGFDAYAVTYISKEANKQQWSENSSVEVSIRSDESSNENPITLKFKANKVGFFKTVEFEQVN